VATERTVEFGLKGLIYAGSTKRMAAG